MADPAQLGRTLQGDPRFPALAALCDEFSGPERLAAIRALGKPELAKLYELAANQPQVSLEYLVPADAPHGQVPWNGKNSLPAFSHFCKVFARSDSPDALWGRNAGPTEWLIGPGYYTCTLRPGVPGEFLIDYTRVPPRAPEGWPPVKKNGAGASFFVFHNMHDMLRPVGKNVAIGGAYDAPSGKFKNQYFALARGEKIEL